MIQILISIHFPHLFIGLLEESTAKWRLPASPKLLKERILHSIIALAMVNQAEWNYSFGLQKLYNFFTNAFSVQYFLWKACFMRVLLWLLSFWATQILPQCKIFVLSEYVSRMKIGDPAYQWNQIFTLELWDLMSLNYIWKKWILWIQQT